MSLLDITTEQSDPLLPHLSFLPRPDFNLTQIDFSNSTLEVFFHPNFYLTSARLFYLTLTFFLTSLSFLTLPSLLF